MHRGNCFDEKKTSVLANGLIQVNVSKQIYRYIVEEQQWGLDILYSILAEGKI